MNKYKLRMRTSTGLGNEYVYVYATSNFERYLNKHNLKYARDIVEDYQLTDRFEKLQQEYEVLQNQVEKLTQENNDLENLYILARDNLSKALLENADLKERVGYLERSNNRKEETIIELRMEQELDKYKDIIDKALKELETYIDFCENDSQGLYEKCDIAIHKMKNILEILRSKE